MKEYAALHFKIEEEYFRLYKYPNYESHKKKHDSFVEKVADVEKRFNDGKLILSFEITTFLKDWIKEHIQGTDKEYSDFLIGKGVK